MNPNEKWAGDVAQAFRLVLSPEDPDDVWHMVKWTDKNKNMPWPTIHAPYFYILAERKTEPLKLYFKAVTRQSLLMGDNCDRVPLAVVGTDLGPVVTVGLEAFLGLVKQAKED